MIFIATAIFIGLTVIAGLHVYWAFGGCWPARDAVGLARTVVGQAQDRMPPRGLTLVVATLILVAGVLPLAYQLGAAPSILRVSLWLEVAVLTLRGLITYFFPAVFGPGIQPFTALNRRYFSPLCLALGAGTAAVAFGG